MEAVIINMICIIVGIVIIVTWEYTCIMYASNKVLKEKEFNSTLFLHIIRAVVLGSLLVGVIYGTTITSILLYGVYGR